MLQRPTPGSGIITYQARYPDNQASSFQYLTFPPHDFSKIIRNNPAPAERNRARGLTPNPKVTYLAPRKVPKPQNKPIPHRRRNARIHLLHPLIINNRTLKIRIYSRHNQLHNYHTTSAISSPPHKNQPPSSPPLTISSSPSIRALTQHRKMTPQAHTPPTAKRPKPAAHLLAARPAFPLVPPHPPLRPEGQRLRKHGRVPM